jgi:hypothetical protein
MSKLLVTPGQIEAIRQMMKEKSVSREQLQRALDNGRVSEFLDSLKKVEGVPAKFALLADLGIITVSANYDHATWLAKFKKENGDKFYYFNPDITDAHFPNPSRILKPGDKFSLRAFKQVVSGATTSEERMAFLATQQAVHTGAQGASLVFEQKRAELPKGYWYASFDEKKQLWEDADGRHRVPEVYAYSDGDFNFRLGYFVSDWNDNHAVLCLCDIK